MHALPQLFKTRLFGIHGSLTAKKLGEQSWADELGQALNSRVEYFFTKKNARTNDIVKAHADVTTALKSLGFNNDVSIDALKMQDGRSEPSD